MSIAPERGEHESTEMDLVNPAGGAALQVTQLVPTSASTSVGGAVNIDNSLNTGAGLVVFSSQAAPAGRLLVARSSSATFSQTVAFFQQAGTGHALHADLTQTNSATASAINATSANQANSAMFLSGVETGRGTLKIAHTNPGAIGADANAAAISIDLKGTNATAAQGIFIDATEGATTGDLMDLRNNAVQLFKIKPDGFLQFGNGGPKIIFCTGSPESQIAAPKGSIALRTDGGAGPGVGASFFVKESGTGNTGWIGK